MATGLAKYIKNSAGQGYELQPSGYYKAIAAPDPTASEVGSINDAYTGVATAEAAPIYDPSVASTKMQNEQDTNNLTTKLAALYSDRGMGGSSFYTGDVANTNKTQSNSLESALAGIQGQRTNYINTRVGNLQNNQLTNDTNDINIARQAEADRKAAEALAADRAWKASEDAKAAEATRIQNEQNYKLSQLQIAAYAGGGSGAGGGGGTSYQSVNDAMADLGSTADYSNGGVMLNGMTREQAGYSLSKATGLSYAKAMAKIYATFRSDAEKNPPAPIKARPAGVQGPMRSNGSF